MGKLTEKAIAKMVDFFPRSCKICHPQTEVYSRDLPAGGGCPVWPRLWTSSLCSRSELGSLAGSLPGFIVFYNGDRKLPDVSYQRLSDAFEPKGSTKGFEDGERSGIVRGKQDDAWNALALGLPLEQIAQTTGLSVEDIQSLAASAVPEPVLA